jgi:hypothetical protein
MHCSLQRTVDGVPHLCVHLQNQHHGWSLQSWTVDAVPLLFVQLQKQHHILGMWDGVLTLFAMPSGEVFVLDLSATQGFHVVAATFAQES